MDLDDKSARIADRLFAVLQVSPTADQAGRVNRIIGQALTDAVLETRSRCVSVAVERCPADGDLAHKLASDERLAKEALIANLCSLR